MWRKVAHAVWVTVAHVGVIIIAHHFADRGVEIGLLIRDEWIVSTADHMLAAVR